MKFGQGPVVNVAKYATARSQTLIHAAKEKKWSDIATPTGGTSNFFTFILRDHRA